MNAIVRMLKPSEFEGVVMLHLEDFGVDLWCAYQGSPEYANDFFVVGEQKAFAVRLQFAKCSCTDKREKIIFPLRVRAECTSVIAVGIYQGDIVHQDEKFHRLDSRFPFKFDVEFGNEPSLADVGSWLEVTGEFFVEAWS